MMWSVQHTLSPALHSPQKKDSFTNFSNKSPSHRLQFFTNCSSMGTLHRMQSFRNCSSSRFLTGPQVLSANMFQHRLLSPWSHRAPARDLTQLSLLTGLQPLLGRSTQPDMGLSTGCRWIPTSPWASTGCRGNPASP